MTEVNSAPAQANPAAPASLEDRHLPDVLVMQNGERVMTSDQWRTKRRTELLELFRTHVYGRSPGRPAKQTFEVVSVTTGMMDGTAIRKQVAVHFEGPHGKGTIRFVMFVPSQAKRPSPAFLLICNRGLENIDPTREHKSPFWPAEELIAQGFAAVAFHVDEADPDEDDGFKNGVHGIFDTERTNESWGTIAAWAWAASRVMDYLETDKDVDARRVAVIGHSRGGKTALWTGAEDERFSLVISNCSGSTGAALARGTRRETIAQINKSFPHWFCANYHKYGGRDHELPVDQHELLALAAPRLLYVASKTLDIYADPQSEFLACVAASPVFELMGQKGVGVEVMPRPDTPIQSGTIAYHDRVGEHDLTLWDWQQYMRFALAHWQ